MQKKQIVRVATFFFVILILLTFFSRTIYRSMLPNVEVSGISGGMLQYTYTSYDIRIKGQRSASILLPVLYTRPMSVRRVFVKPNQHIAPGDVMIQFEAADGEYLIEEAERKLDLATSTFTVWQMERDRQMTNLAASIKKSKKADRALLKEDLALLESGVMNGTTQAQLAAEVDLWEKTLESLRALKDDQWQLRTQIDGFVERIWVKEGDEYPGLDSLLTICPEGSTYWVGCVWKDAPALRLDEWIIKGMIGIDAALLAIDTDNAGNETIIWFEDHDGILPPDQIASVEVRADSPYNKMMVANRAFSTSSKDVLYLLKSRTGAWGQTEYFVEETLVRTGLQDASHTSITSGLNYNDVLVVSSNKPLQNGQTVLLTSFE